MTTFLRQRKTISAVDESALEREIDVLVYQLYGPTEEEIKVVEGKTEEGMVNYGLNRPA